MSSESYVFNECNIEVLNIKYNNDLITFNQCNIKELNLVNVKVIQSEFSPEQIEALKKLGEGFENLDNKNGR